MVEFEITSNQIVSICTFIAAVWGVWKIIKELKKPNADMKRVVKDHTCRLDDNDERIKDVEETNKMILQCLLVIINHDITGNGIDKMKEVRDNLQEYLVNR